MGIESELEGISTPDVVDTAIGELRFRDGAPLPDTVELVYDYLDRARGVEVFLNAMPGASVYALVKGPQALGVSRTHGCCCAGDARVGCPLCAIKAQHGLLRQRFPHSWSEGKFVQDFPLFPTVAGDVPEKHAVAETIAFAATLLKCPLVSPDGAAKITGHSLRVTGAQGLARAGLDAWAIQLLGRWGSSTVLSYIQEVPLENSSSWARRAVSAPTVKELIGAGSSACAALPCASLLFSFR